MEAILTRENLRRLADLSGPERAFVSLYLPRAEAMKGLSRRAEAIRLLLKEHPAEAEHFQRNMEQIEAHLAEEPVGDSGRCVFSGWAVDLFVASALPSEVGVDGLLLRAGSTPYIKPLAEFHDEYENFLAVIADNEKAQVFTVTSAVADRSATVRGGVKNQVRVGGWSQARYQRRRENQLLHYAKEIVDELIRLDNRLHFRRFFLVGSNEIMEEIVRHLPKGLAERMRDAKAVDLGDDTQVWEEINRLNEEEERRSERELWTTIREEFLSGGRAALGVADVLQAAQEGRVERAVASRDQAIRGWQCRNCGALAAEAAEACSQCGGQDWFEVDLLNHLTSLLYSTSAEIDFVDPIPQLGEAGHLAALLRY